MTRQNPATKRLLLTAFVLLAESRKVPARYALPMRRAGDVPRDLHAIFTRPMAMLEAKGRNAMATERKYRAFLVRLWTVTQNGGFVWRASAQDAHTGGCRAFADLAGLYAFLQEVTESPPGRQPGKEEPVCPDE